MQLPSLLSRGLEIGVPSTLSYEKSCELLSV
jgi:hypothetical protein